MASRNLLDRLSHIFESHSLSTAIVMIWSAGVFLSLANLVIGTCRLHGTLRGSSAVPDSVLSKFDGQMIGAKRIRVLISETSNGPFCWQVHCPTIVLPTFIMNWPNETIDSVVRHELAHLRSHHPMHLFCQRIIECFFGFILLCG
ncbi:M56 family metallopeptidase [Planctomycetota bacterium]